MGLKACEKFFNKLKKKSVVDREIGQALETFLRNGIGKARCGKAWTDTWYIPRKYSQMFIKVPQVAYDSSLISEIAVNNIISSLDSSENIQNLNGRYLPDLGITYPYTIDAKNFWANYDLKLTFMHPIKYNTHERNFTLALLRSWVMDYKNSIVQC